MCSVFLLGIEYNRQSFTIRCLMTILLPFIERHKYYTVWKLGQYFYIPSLFIVVLLLACVSVHLPAYLPVCPSACLSVNPSVCLSVCLSIYLPAYLSVCLLVFLFVYLSITSHRDLLSIAYVPLHSSFCLPVRYLSVYLSGYQYICLPIRLSVCSCL